MSRSNQARLAGISEYNVAENEVVVIVDGDDGPFGFLGVQSSWHSEVFSAVERITDDHFAAHGRLLFPRRRQSDLERRRPFVDDPEMCLLR